MECKTPNMYFLSENTKMGTRPPWGRLIVSANGCPTERNSAFVDHVLNPLSTHNTYCVKDTTHFLKITRDSGIVPMNSYLVTLDVTSLYTNICITIGIQAAKESLDKFR